MNVDYSWRYENELLFGTKAVHVFELEDSPPVVHAHSRGSDGSGDWDVELDGLVYDVESISHHLPIYHIKCTRLEIHLNSAAQKNPDGEWIYRSYTHSGVRGLINQIDEFLSMFRNLGEVEVIWIFQDIYEARLAQFARGHLFHDLARVLKTKRGLRRIWVGYSDGYLFDGWDQPRAGVRRRDPSMPGFAPNSLRWKKVGGRNGRWVLF
ncbi:hypothetical protein EJ08DRAFT_659389 [Tothia fuscella]|uniref:Uncharacterized protein n=1 Tax=Tothia fuscella TaxID=1048955 RepID=A0A9P4U0K8_9PEZI|nr:hypothetical protein EJ08DRAFT_659389 [Tothia fuscella]